jgi:ribosomal protein S18 acetylase RimI-like enzyme
MLGLMATSMDGYDCSSLLMAFGRDVTTFFSASSSAGLIRIDDHGWLGLSGEPSCADLNMAGVVSSASSAVVDDYVDAVEERGLDAILFVGDHAPHLVDAALARGLTAAGEVPIMVWRRDALDVSTGARRARQVAENEVPAVNAIIANAFSLDEDAVQRTMPPSILAAGADVWIVEEEGNIAGSGTFVRSGDHVAIYCMATESAFQRQGIGRAVLETAMGHYLEQGVTTFTLEATAAGIRLYQQIGFETVAQAPAFVIGLSTQLSN